MKRLFQIVIIGISIIGLSVACSQANPVQKTVDVPTGNPSEISVPLVSATKLANYDFSIQEPDSPAVSRVPDYTPEPTPAVPVLPEATEAPAPSEETESDALPSDETAFPSSSVPASDVVSEDIPAKKKVALTFDDGPRTERTNVVLDILEQYGAKATFFVLGSSITDESAPLLQRMVDLNCEIGIHGLDHTTMTKLPYDSQVKRLNRMKEIISDRINGGYEVRLMRPPGGGQNIRVRNAALEADLSVILWSVDTADWQSGNRDKILEICKKKIRNGSIILMHDKLKATHAAVAELVPYLQEQGYELVTVSELFENSEEPLEAGVVYYENKSLSE